MSAAMDAVAVSRACVSGGSGRRAAANAPAVRCTKKKFTQSVTASPLSAQLKKNARAAVAQKKNFTQSVTASPQATVGGQRLRVRVKYFYTLYIVLTV